MAEITLSSNEFRALSNEIRVNIIKSLKDRNYTLTELAKKMEMASPSMKQHLDVLVESGLIEQRDEGRKWKYYSLTRKGANIVSPEKYDTTILIVLAVSSIAMVCVLMVLFSSISATAGFSRSGDLAGGMPTYNVPDDSKEQPEAAGGEIVGGEADSEFGPLAQAFDLILVYASAIVALFLAALIGFFIAKFYIRRR